MPDPKLPLLDLDLPILDFDTATGSLDLPDLGLVAERPEIAPLERSDRDPVDLVEATIEATRIADTAYQTRERTEKERFQLATDSEYWVCVCFETREQKEEWLRRAKLIGLGDKHIDGLAAAEIMGIQLHSPRAVWSKTRGFTGLAKLAGGEPESR